MPYTKLQTTCPDHAIGIDGIGALQENQSSLFSSMSAQHGYNDGLSVNPLLAIGAHNQINIARDSVRVSVLVLGPQREVLLSDISRALYYGSSPSVGEYDISSRWLYSDIPTAHPLHSSGTRICVASSLFTGTTDCAVHVSCYELSAGDFVLSDFPFSLTVFGA